MKTLYFSKPEEISSRMFIKYLIEAKKSENISASIRALGKRGGFSPSSLSRVLNGEQKCTLEFSDRLSKALKLNERDMIFLKRIILYETSKSEEIRAKLVNSILSSPLNFSFDKSKDKSEVLKAFEELKISRVINYYNQDFLEQRSLHLFNDLNNNSVKSFFDTLISVKNSVSSVSFFIESETESQFDVYLDALDDERRGAFKVAMANRQVEVEFSDSGFPQIKSIVTHFIHQTKFGVLDFNFNESELKISGDIFDTLDSDYMEFYERSYVRIN